MSELSTEADIDLNYVLFQLTNSLKISFDDFKYCRQLSIEIVNIQTIVCTLLYNC